MYYHLTPIIYVNHIVKYTYIIDYIYIPMPSSGYNLILNGFRLDFQADLRILARGLISRPKGFCSK